MLQVQPSVRELYGKIQPIIGQAAWRVALGHGSFLTFDFGKQLPQQEGQKRAYGEWYLWIYLANWTLSQNDRFLAACEDPRSKLEKAVAELNNHKLVEVEIVPPTLETIFTFESGLTLRVSPTSTEQGEHWKLFTPDNQVLLVGPGGNWKQEEVGA